MADDVTLTIGGNRFRYWTEVQITRSIDAISTVQLLAPFEPDESAHRDLFRPFTFRDIVVKVDGEALLTGTVVNTLPDQTADATTVELAGYGRPGVLDNCKQGPIEYRGQTLSDLLLAEAALFDVEVDYRLGRQAAFDKVAREPGDTPFKFLTELAKQRGGLLTDSPEGKLLCWQEVDTSPQLGLFTPTLETAPLVRVAPSFDPENYFSEITGYGQSKRNRPQPSYTTRNPLTSGIYRPTNVDLGDLEGGDISTATDAELGRMMGQAVGYEVSGLPSWRDPNGELWAPNTKLKLKAPGAFIYSPYEFLIRSVTYHMDAHQQTCSLGLVLPGAFRGVAPSSYPWD